MNPGGHVAAAARSPVPLATPGRIAPDLRVTHWFSGKYAFSGMLNRNATPAVHPAAGPTGIADSWTPSAPTRVHRSPRASAGDQLRNARERAAAARDRIRRRATSRAGNFPSGVNSGVVVALCVFLGILGTVVYGLLANSRNTRVIVHTPDAAQMPLPVVADWASDAEASVQTAGQPLARGVVSDAVNDSRVLVVCEWSKFDHQRQAIIASQIEHLADAGFLLLGDFVTGQDPVSDFDLQSAELVASLRASVGTRPYLSAGARDSIREWLDTHGDAEMVVWFANVDANQPVATAWIVSGSDIAEPVALAAKDVLKKAD